MGETRNSSAEGPLRRLDLLVTSPTRRSGVELLINGKELEKHGYEQATTYLIQQRLDNVLVVNFASTDSGIVDRIPQQLPHGVGLLQVLVDFPSGRLTPYILQQDTLVAGPQAPLTTDRAPAEMEGLVTSLHKRRRADEASRPTPNCVMLGDVAFGLTAVHTIKGLLAAIAEEIGEPLGSLQLWSMSAHGGSALRYSQSQDATVLADVGCAPGAHLEVRFDSSRPALLLTLCYQP